MSHSRYWSADREPVINQTEIVAEVVAAFERYE